MKNIEEQIEEELNQISSDFDIETEEINKYLINYLVGKKKITLEDLKSVRKEIEEYIQSA